MSHRTARTETASRAGLVIVPNRLHASRNASADAVRSLSTMSRMRPRLTLTVLVDDDVPQAGDRCPGRAWTFGLEVARQCPHRLADHGQIPEDGVIRHRAMVGRFEIVAILDAARDGRQNVAHPLVSLAGHTAMASASAVKETTSRRRVAATTSTRRPRSSLSSSASPATRSNSFPPGRERGPPAGQGHCPSPRVAACD